MTRKSMVRAACVIAAGLIVAVSAPVIAAPADQAAETGKPLTLVQSAKPHAKAVSHKRKAKVAVHQRAKQKSAAARKQERPEVSETSLPPKVANAKAEMTQSEARGAAEITAFVAPLEIAASEQMNELDRSISAVPEESQPRAIQTQLVKEDQPQASMPIVVADSASATPQIVARERKQTANVTVVSGDAWAQSSLIGKIFIAFGGMLTLASAARMLIA